MGSDVGQIFPTASLHRDHSISYALVCEKRFSIPRSNLRYPYPVCKNQSYRMGDNTGIDRVVQLAA